MRARRSLTPRKEFRTSEPLTRGFCYKHKLYRHGRGWYDFSKLTMGKTEHTGGHAYVTLGKDGVIYCDLYGNITGAVVSKSMSETARLVQEQHQKGEKAYLVIDVSNITSQSSEARSRAKEVNSFGLTKLAIVGANRMLATIGQYIVKAGGMGDYTRFFRTRKQAQDWILNGDSILPDTNIAARNVSIGLVLLIAIGVLLSRLTNNTAVSAFLPNIELMNPFNAVVFILLSAAVLCLKRGEMHGWRKKVAAAAGVFCIVYGLLMLRLLLGWATPLDAMFFAQNANIQSSVPPNTTLNFMFIGAMLLALATGQKQHWQRIAFHVASVALFITTIGAIVGITFGLSVLFNGNFTAMSLSAALAFLFLNHALQTITHPLPFFAKSMRWLDKYWQPIVVLTGLLLCVGLAWQQSLRDLDTNAKNTIKEEFTLAETALNQRFASTINTLRGFKGFFEASDFVSAAEYTNFYEGAKPAGGYPGFSAISFTRAVSADKSQAYVNSIKQQVGAPTTPKQFASFRLNPVNSNPNHIYYPITYVNPYTDTTSTFGYDAGLDPIRRAGFEKARDTGEPTATETLNIVAANPNTPARYGFVISIPVYTLSKGEAAPTTVEQRRAKIYGFVNSVFNNETLFANIFKPVADPSVKYVLSDASDSDAVYTHQANTDVQPEPVMSSAVTAGGRTWQLSMYAPNGFGTTGLARAIPTIILIGGTLLSLLTAGLIFSLSRRRQQALLLASNMTEDLHKERDAAIVARQKDEAILSSIGDAVFAVDTNGRITLFNPAAEHSSGYSHEEAIGKQYGDILKFILEKDRKVNDAFIKRALAGHVSAMQNHTKLIRKDGTEIYVADSAAPIRDAKGGIIGAIIVFRDVTEEYALEQAKSEFVSLASHQLRTPLSAINWTAEMLLDGTMGKLTKDQNAQVQEIYDGNQRMIELVNSLLDVSRLDLGKLINAPVPTDMTELATSLEKELATSIKGKNMKFEKHIQHKLAPVSADPKLLRMILQNLLSNAVKYTPAKGTVTLEMRPATKAEIASEHLRTTEPCLFISVTDTGYGIPKEQQHRIFEKMFRADNVRKMDVEGTGLGLYIVREVAQKLGGSIRFESKESIGTTFYVILPFTTKPSQLPDSGSVVK